MLLEEIDRKIKAQLPLVSGGLSAQPFEDGEYPEGLPPQLRGALESWHLSEARWGGQPAIVTTSIYRFQPP